MPIYIKNVPCPLFINFVSQLKTDYFEITFRRPHISVYDFGGYINIHNF